MSDPVKSGRVTVTNISDTPRVIYDVDGKVYKLLPGASAALFVGERQERDLRRSPRYTVNDASDDDGVPAPQPKPMNTVVPPAEEEPVLSYQELLDKVDEMDYPALLRHAKATLADEFPTGRAGGQPRKAEIVRILRRLAAA